MNGIKKVYFINLFINTQIILYIIFYYIFDRGIPIMKSIVTDFQNFLDTDRDYNNLYGLWVLFLFFLQIL